MEKKQNRFESVTEVLVVIWEVLCLWYLIISDVVKGIYEFFVPPPPRDIKGEIALITGAGHGIGRQMALQFSSLGAKVVCVDINPTGNAETVKMIEKQDGIGYKYECDITNRAAVLQMAEKVQKEVGDVTILVNNAGIMPCKPLLEHTEQEIRLIMDLNVNANLWTLQAFLPTMKKNNYGHIVAMSSMAGLQGVKNVVPYCASKYGVRGIMQATEVELRQTTGGKSKIKFTTVYPYIVNTGLAKKPHIRFSTLMKIEEPEDVARQVVDAMRRGYTEISTPANLFTMFKLGSVLPEKANARIIDFVDATLEV